MMSLKWTQENLMVEKGREIYFSKFYDRKIDGGG
jgi:hypothetical protein